MFESADEREADHGVVDQSHDSWLWEKFVESRDQENPVVKW